MAINIVAKLPTSIGNPKLIIRNNFNVVPSNPVALRFLKIGR